MDKIVLPCYCAPNDLSNLRWLEENWQQYDGIMSFDNNCDNCSEELCYLKTLTECENVEFFHFLAKLGVDAFSLVNLFVRENNFHKYITLQFETEIGPVEVDTKLPCTFDLLKFGFVESNDKSFWYYEKIFSMEYLYFEREIHIADYLSDDQHLTT